MIRAQQLFKKYQDGVSETIVLKHLDLEIKAGEFVAIIGPSGAGKSTLLYQLSLLDRPTSGEIWLDEVKTSELNEIEKTTMRLNKFGYVFQDYALLPELTAEENVMLPILMQGAGHHEARKKAERALVKIGLESKVKNLPSQLSGGEQQRVSIARAIAHNPIILFADEPTANLDSANGRVVMDAFSEIHDEKQTIVMVTHEPEYAKRAGRIITLKDGKIVSDERER